MAQLPGATMSWHQRTPPLLPSSHACFPSSHACFPSRHSRPPCFGPRLAATKTKHMAFPPPPRAQFPRGGALEKRWLRMPAGYSAFGFGGEPQRNSFKEFPASELRFAGGEARCVPHCCDILHLWFATVFTISFTPGAATICSLPAMTSPAAPLKAGAFHVSSVSKHSPENIWGSISRNFSFIPRFAASIRSSSFNTRTYTPPDGSVLGTYGGF